MKQKFLNLLTAFSPIWKAEWDGCWWRQKPNPRLTVAVIDFLITRRRTKKGKQPREWSQIPRIFNSLIVLTIQFWSLVKISDIPQQGSSTLFLTRSPPAQKSKSLYSPLLPKTYILIAPKNPRYFSKLDQCRRWFLNHQQTTHRAKRRPRFEIKTEQSSWKFIGRLLLSRKSHSLHSIKLPYRKRRAADMAREQLDQQTRDV